MVLPGLQMDEQQEESQEVRHLRNRDVPLPNPLRRGDEDEGRHRASSMVSEDSHRGGSTLIGTGSELGRRGEVSPVLERRDVGRESVRSQSSRRSHVSDLQMQLEDMEAEVQHQRRLRQLQAEADATQRQADAARRQAEADEAREQYELEKVRRRLRRASQGGSKVSYSPSLCSVGEQSPRQRTSSWVERQVSDNPAVLGSGGNIVCVQGTQCPSTSFDRHIDFPSTPVRVFPAGPSHIQTPVTSNRPIPNNFQGHEERVTSQNSLGWDSYLARKAAGKTLPIFSGDPLDWLTFISAYRRSTVLGKYSEDENMLRLGKALTGKARESVRSLLAVPNASHEVIRVLELQFGRPVTIINSLIEKVRKFPRMTCDDAQSIIDFSIRVNNLVVTIECLDQIKYLSNPQLLDEVVGKLSPSYRLQWGDFLAMNLGGEGDLQDFKKWLNNKGHGAAHVCTPSRSNLRPEPAVRQVNVVEQGASSSMRNSKQLICYFCRGNHTLRTCPSFTDLSPADRNSWARKSRLCYSCLSREHQAQNCKRPKVCGIDGCQYKHHTLLHGVTRITGSDKKDTNVVTHSYNSSSGVLLKILPVRVKGPLGEQVVSALLDDGANCSIIDHDLAMSLGLAGQKSPLCVQWIKDMSTKEEDSELVELSVSGVQPGSRTFTLQKVRTIGGLSLCHQNMDKENLRKIWPRSSHVPLGVNTSAPKLIIGEDHSSIIETQRCIRREWNGLALSKTRLGWVLHGSFIPDNTVPYIARPFHICQIEKPDDDLHKLVKGQFSLDFLDDNVKISHYTHEEEKAMDILDKTAKYVGGRWEVGLLWNTTEKRLVDSYTTALRRLVCVENKCLRDQTFAEKYSQKINDYIAKGYARKLSNREVEDKCDRKWYLPHLAVFNPNKPEKIRVVFDASAKSLGVSLNSLLLQGPDLYNSIPKILIRFRRGMIGFGGDIREMFLQIRIRDEDQSAQRFLWRGMDRERVPDQYVMQVMLFGAVCSPFIAQEIRDRNASRYRSSHPEAVNAVKEAHYMDDYLDSTDSENEAIRRIKDIIMIHSSGGFQMVNWVSNSSRVMEEINSILKEPTGRVFDPSHSEKVLGLRWNPTKDVFIFQLNRNRIPQEILMLERCPTKREFLRITMSIFDPLGFLGWYLINVKILLQDIWRSKTGWDEVIDKNLKPRWDQWVKNLNNIETVEIPRCYTQLIPRATVFELHIFCDASDRAYAALAYIRVIAGNNEVAVSLIASKSRVAPLKQISVPRLELQAAVLGSRLAKSLRVGCGFLFDRECYWSDSKTVLHWISHSEVRYRMFVAHRIGEIVEATDPQNWRWLPGKDNPADDSTKGQSFMSDRWLNGPDFLRFGEDTWPRSGDCSSVIAGSEVLEQLHLIVSRVSFSEGLPKISRFSNFLRLIRATSWLLRFIKRCRKIRNLDEGSVISPRELYEAEELWWKAVQHEDFAAEISELKKGRVVSGSSRLYRLSPFLDDTGVLRVSGRIQRARNIPDDTKQPTILDPRNKFVLLLIDHHHQKACHQGQEYVANELRQRYWILGLRRAVRRAWHRCPQCAKERAKPFQQPMAPLPKDRLNYYSRPFTNTGLDYFGPLYVTIRRSKEKRYGALFSCLTTRAIHLELVSDLTTNGTLLAIRRMASRRGCPSHIWSDNGTNFRGVDRLIRSLLGQLDQSAIEEELATRHIEWHFLPPATPHMGGSWERLIWSVKKALMATMKSMSPHEEVLHTLMLEAEHLVNSRPLTAVSDDPLDEEALTPNHFLIGSSSGLSPWFEDRNQKLNLRKRWQLTEHLAEQFWRRWLREYLPGLVTRTKWFNGGERIEVGQLVYLADKQGSRGKWKPGRILATFPGSDGFVRVVDVKTSDGVLRRPVTSLLPLLPGTGVTDLRRRY